MCVCDVRWSMTLQSWALVTSSAPFVDWATMPTSWRQTTCQLVCRQLITGTAAIGIMQKLCPCF